MAIIQSYPINYNIQGSDLLLGVTNSLVNGRTVYQTKSFRLSDIIGGEGANISIGTANGLSAVGNVLSLGLSSESTNGALSSVDWATFNGKQNALTGIGLVKSVDGSVSYITDNSANWTTAYNNSITAAAVTGTTTKVLTLTQQDLGTITASWTDLNSAITIGTPANGLSLASTVLSLGLASTLNTGALSSADWNTFNGKQSVLTFTSPLANTSNTISIPAASATASGYLTAANWTAFNSKQNALSGTGLVRATGTTISYDSTIYTPTTTTITINGTTQNLSANRTWTVATHDPVTIGTSANGLSILGQVLSLALSSSTTAGALSAANWTTFNSKQPQLSGTGFIKASGTTISYDNSTYALDSAVVKLAGAQTITGAKTFSTDVAVTGSVTASAGFFNSDIRLKKLVDYDYSVASLEPIEYTWKDGRDNKKHVGYSAQEVQNVMPDAISEDKDGVLSVNYIEVLVAKIALIEEELKILKSKV